jgi:N utilization substance protein B
MGKRRDGREAAVQFLYQRDLNSADGESPSPADFWALRPATKKIQDFATELIEGILENQADIDSRIKKYVANYELDRIAAVDRNILRVAIYEMLFCKDVPPVVSINEAIEIAKRFGSDDSGRFVNGVLDRLRHDLPRPARTAE